MYYTYIVNSILYFYGEIEERHRRGTQAEGYRLGSGPGEKGKRKRAVSEGNRDIVSKGKVINQPIERVNMVKYLIRCGNPTLMPIQGKIPS